MTNSFVIIVPARAGSTRLPNKPMAMINGRTVISRIIELANSSNASNVYIATDNGEIKNHCESCDANVVMTSSNHISGMDRIAEAARILDLNDDVPIVNLQGDEPFMPVQIINQLPILLSIDAPISTACIKFSEGMDINSPHEVKVVRSIAKEAMSFSRSLIHSENTADYRDNLKHLGIYAYENKTLQELTALKPTSNELQEKLEQLRFLDHGYNIFVEDYPYESPIGIETPADLEREIEFSKAND